MPCSLRCGAGAGTGSYASLWLGLAHIGKPLFKMVPASRPASLGKRRCMLIRLRAVEMVFARAADVSLWARIVRVYVCVCLLCGFGTRGFECFVRR